MKKRGRRGPRRRKVPFVLGIKANSSTRFSPSSPSPPPRGVASFKRVHPTFHLFPRLERLFPLPSSNLSTGSTLRISTNPPRVSESPFLPPFFLHSPPRSIQFESANSLSPSFFRRTERSSHFPLFSVPWIVCWCTWPRRRRN